MSLKDFGTGELGIWPQSKDLRLQDAEQPQVPIHTVRVEVPICLRVDPGSCLTPIVTVDAMSFSG